MKKQLFLACILVLSSLSLNGCKKENKNKSDVEKDKKAQQIAYALEDKKIDDILSGKFKLPDNLDKSNLPKESSINMIPIKVKDSKDINMAWVSIMKTQYESGKPTPVNQTMRGCIETGRPHGEQIYIPEICYMIPVEYRNNKNKIVKKDILLLGKDDIVSLQPLYRDGKNIIARAEISQENGDFKTIPLLTMNETAFNVLSSMVNDVGKILSKRVTSKISPEKDK